MKNTLRFLVLPFIFAISLISCEKKTLTLDNETSMKTLLKASDQEITELVKKEAAEKANIDPENLDVEYILRDTVSQAVVVKSKIKNQK